MSRRSAIGGLHRATNPAAPRARGFSLLEILVVLALFGLMSALLIGGSGAFLKSISRDDVENTTLTAIASARNAAVLAGQTLELRIDEKTRTLDWGAGTAPLVAEGEVRLLPPAKTGSVLIGGRLVENPLARVRFYADGTCDPFRLEIVRDQASHLLNIDPWTCTVLAGGETDGRR